MNTKTIIFLIILSFGSVEMYAQVPTINVTIRVTDEKQVPVLDASIRTGYFQLSGGHRVIEGKTDENGVFSFTGNPAENSIQALVRKAGFYQSEKRFSVAKSVDGQAFNTDTEVDFTLREIRNPVPMAAGRIRMEYSESQGSFKYDLMKRDWLPPHGRGQTADLLVHVDFVYRDLNDHDMQITWEFIGEANGIQSFEPMAESHLISPHEAPMDGYKSKVSWRNRRYLRDGEGPPRNRMLVEHVNDLSSSGDGGGVRGRHFYLFRIRAEMDEDGEIEGGHYGKIYGFGAMLRPDGDFPGGHHTGVVYLNPNEGDQNIEMDLEANLLKDLPRFYGPRRP